LRIRVPKQITPRDAVRLQRKLSPLVKETSELPTPIHNLVGCDATYFSEIAIAAATQVRYADQSLLKIRSTTEHTRFPYIPGLLAFREAPVVLRAIRGLHANDYVCLVDAHGIAHPRRFGLACYVGLALDRPTIGVAKSLLYGQAEGSRVVDGEDGRILAELVKTPGGKTIYVSVGHKISLEDAVLIVKHCMGSGGPVPIRLAHDEVTKRKWQLKNSNQAS
jgi:deoxyribonuclease V